MIIYLFKQTHENISNGDSEQDRKAQSALTTALKKPNTGTIMQHNWWNLVNTMIAIYDRVHEVTVMKLGRGQ